MYVDILESMLRADTCSNIPYTENIRNSSAGFKFLNIAEPTCVCDAGKHGRVRSS
jgi:hypothetical protein